MAHAHILAEEAAAVFVHHDDGRLAVPVGARAHAAVHLAVGFDASAVTLPFDAVHVMEPCAGGLGHEHAIAAVEGRAGDGDVHAGADVLLGELGTGLVATAGQNNSLASFDEDARSVGFFSPYAKHFLSLGVLHELTTAGLVEHGSAHALVDFRHGS